MVVPNFAGSMRETSLQPPASRFNKSPQRSRNKSSSPDYVEKRRNKSLARVDARDGDNDVIHSRLRPTPNSPDHKRRGMDAPPSLTLPTTTTMTATTATRGTVILGAEAIASVERRDDKDPILKRRSPAITMQAAAAIGMRRIGSVESNIVSAAHSGAVKSGHGQTVIAWTPKPFAAGVFRHISTDDAPLSPKSKSPEGRSPKGQSPKGRKARSPGGKSTRSRDPSSEYFSTSDEGFQRHSEQTTSQEIRERIMSVYSSDRFYTKNIAVPQLNASASRAQSPKKKSSARAQSPKKKSLARAKAEQTKSFSSNTSSYPSIHSSAATVSVGFRPRPPKIQSNHRTARNSAQQKQQPQSDEDDDLDFVESYDRAFTEFLALHPEFTQPPKQSKKNKNKNKKSNISSESLLFIQSIRLAKLTRLLERQDEMEKELLDQFQVAQTAKHQMEQRMHARLKVSARLKAARETQTKTILRDRYQSLRQMEAQLIWNVVQDSLVRAKKQFSLEIARELYPTGRDRISLYCLLPADDTDFVNVKRGMLTPGSSLPVVNVSKHNNATSSPDKECDEEKELRMKNAFLNGEVKILLGKVEYQKALADRYSWVEKVLVQMDDSTIRKLKARFEHNAGVNV